MLIKTNPNDQHSITAVYFGSKQDVTGALLREGSSHLPFYSIKTKFQNLTIWQI